MEPLSTAAAGVSSLLGGTLGNFLNAHEARKARDFNAAEAEKNRQFQERMSGSSYQRAVMDMRAAGINPMLAYAQGGASTPSGSAASGPAAQARDPISPAVSSAQAATRLKADMAVMDTQIGQIQAQTNFLNEQAQTQGSLRTESAARTLGALEEATLTRNRGREAGIRADIFEDLGKLLDMGARPAAELLQNPDLWKILGYEGSSAVSASKLWARNFIINRLDPLQLRTRVPQFLNRNPQLTGWIPRPGGKP